MSAIKETAEQFFEACETGKGWEGCLPYCHADATFSAQAGALAGVDTVQAYTDWMKGLALIRIGGHVPKGGYDVPHVPKQWWPAPSPAVL